MSSGGTYLHHNACSNDTIKSENKTQHHTWARRGLSVMPRAAASSSSDFPSMAQRERRSSLRDPTCAPRDTRSSLACAVFNQNASREPTSVHIHRRQ